MTCSSCSRWHMSPNTSSGAENNQTKLAMASHLAYSCKKANGKNFMTWQNVASHGARQPQAAVQNETTWQERRVYLIYTSIQYSSPTRRRRAIREKLHVKRFFARPHSVYSAKKACINADTDIAPHTAQSQPVNDNSFRTTFPFRGQPNCIMSKPRNLDNPGIS